MLGYKPSQEMLSLAISQPHKALRQLLSQSEMNYGQSPITNRLTNEDIEIIRKAPVIQEVMYFLQSAQKTANVM